MEINLVDLYNRSIVDNLPILRRLAAPAIIITAVTGGVIVALDYIGGERARIEAARQAAEAVIGEKNSLIKASRDQREVVERARDLYQDLERRGFLERHSQIEVQQIINRAAEELSINSATFEFGPEATLPLGAELAFDLEVGRTVEARLITRPIELRIQTYSDGEVYAFIDRLIQRIPGEAQLRRFSLAPGEISREAALDRLRLGERPNLVRASAVIDWSILLVTPARAGG